MSRLATPVDDEQTAPIYRAAIATMTWGFRLAAGILVAGLAVALARREALEHEVDPFADVFPALFRGNASGIIDLAIITIMVTPLVTVITVAFGFRRIGDRRYAMYSFLVLGILGVSVALSLVR